MNTNYVPRDTLIEILKKLPPRSITRFLSVSKEWAGEIRGRELQDAHYEESQKKTMLILLRLVGRRVPSGNDGEPFHTVNQESPELSSDRHPITTLPAASNYQVISEPVRGLVCLGSDRYLLLANPATRTFMTVLELEQEPPQTRFRLSKRTFCFGCEEKTNKFKIVQSECVGSQSRHRILTVGEHIWRTIPWDAPYSYVTNSLCIGGKIYHGALQKSIFIVVCIDLTLESISTQVVPVGFPLSLTTKLTSFDGQPSFVNDAGFDLTHTGEFKLCLMDKVSLEWVVKDIPVKGWKETVSTPFSFLGTIPSGELVFARNVLEDDRQVLLYYNRDNETLHRYEIQMDHADEYLRVQIFLNFSQSSYYM